MAEEDMKPLSHSIPCGTGRVRAAHLPTEAVWLWKKDLINDMDGIQCLTNFEDLNVIAGLVHMLVCFFISRWLN